MGFATAVAALVVAWLATRPALYTGTLTFRIDEALLRDATRPPTVAASIREYVHDVVLTRERLGALLRRYGLSPRLRASDPAMAVDDFRESISIVVVRNDFLIGTWAADSPRSALLTLSFTGDDRERVRSILHELGGMFLEDQAAARSGRIEMASRSASHVATNARERLRLLEDRRASLVLQQVRSARERPAIAAELAALQSEITSAQVMLQDLDRRVASLDFASHAEHEQLLLRCELVDEGVARRHGTLTRPALAACGALALLAALPVAALLVGAFDHRIYRGADVTGRGFQLLAAVPHFPGVDAAPDAIRRAPPLPKLGSP
jgi:hypothetical protein